MKVVIFCGGMGMRIRDYTDAVPKPMVPIGYRPILWHVMKYYAHFGHNEFILCLGYKADSIKNYFLNYNECLSNDFVLEKGGRDLRLLNTDIQDWKITFVDTGLNANIGQRLKAVEPYVKDEEMFLANYSDGLTNCPLPDLVEHYRKHDAVATFMAVKPTQSFHVVAMGQGASVADIHHISMSPFRINGGYFLMSPKVFDYMREGEELVSEPFTRLIGEGRLIAYPYDGFWACMDTFKDKQVLEEMYAGGKAPWALGNDGFHAKSRSNGKIPEKELAV